MMKNGLFVLSLILCCSVSAEMRMWTGTDGKRFRGEFDKELFGDIRVKDSFGKAHLIPFEKLSKGDLDYVLCRVPPEMEIKFFRESHIRPRLEWAIERDVTTLYDCTVRLDKTSDMPNKTKLTAELFILAEEVDGENFILIHRERSDFIFPEGKRSSHEFIVKDIPIRTYSSIPWESLPFRMRGARYFGYVVAVSDLEKKLVTYKTDIRDLDWFLEDMPRTVEELRLIAINGRGSIYSRHFDEFFSKTETPRIPWHRRPLL